MLPPQEGVHEVGVLLLHGGDDPASPAGQRLAAFMRAHSQVRGFAALSFVHLYSRAVPGVHWYLLLLL